MESEAEAHELHAGLDTGDVLLFLGGALTSRALGQQSLGLLAEYPAASLPETAAPVVHGLHQGKRRHVPPRRVHFELSAGKVNHPFASAFTVEFHAQLDVGFSVECGLAERGGDEVFHEFFGG